MIKNSELRRGIEMAAGIADDYTSSSGHPYRLGDCVLWKLNATNRKPRKNLHANDQWLRGYAAALAAIIRLHDQVSVAKSALSGDGITLAKLKRAGVDQFDMEQLRKTSNAENDFVAGKPTFHGKIKRERF